jgi:hypothetical protein
MISIAVVTSVPNPPCSRARWRRGRYRTAEVDTTHELTGPGPVRRGASPFGRVVESTLYFFLGHGWASFFASSSRQY